MTPPRPDDEEQRLAAVARLAASETPGQAAWDDIAQLASLICQTPIALVTVIDDQRQWFRAQIGVSGDETARDDAFCAHAILEPDRIMVIPDAHEDPMFASNPFVTGDPWVRFYAGVPLLSGEHALGTLCVIDRQPRELRPDQVEALTILARIAERQLPQPG